MRQNENTSNSVLTPRSLIRSQNPFAFNSKQCNPFEITDMIQAKVEINKLDDLI